MHARGASIQSPSGADRWVSVATAVDGRGLAFPEALAEDAGVATAVERSDLDDESVTFRFGLHWGARLYVGQIQTAGRSEVTAVGDEVNDAARIEACASGGRTHPPPSTEPARYRLGER